MSSNTSTQGELRDLITRSLTVLKREHPPAYGALHASLRGQQLLLEVEEERFGLSTEADALVLAAPPASATVELRTTRRALLALLAQEHSLLEAVLREQLVLKGAVLALARFHDSLALYLQGAVRSPSFPALLEELHHLSPPTS